MSARVLRRISLGKASILVFVIVAVLTALFMVKMSQGEAVPANPTDNTTVPHYFGPWPNWALSPLTLPDVTVTINGAHETTATAVASVGSNGVITGITVTDPGSGYTAATVSFAGAGAGATARAVVTGTGAVTGVTVGAGGSGYKSPRVSFTGGGATTAATGTVYGGVDAITLANPGSGYTLPTVDFDLPDDPNGTPATGHATLGPNGSIAAILLDNPGSGYSSAPTVVIRDGTLMDPIANGGFGATATCTLKVLSVALDTFGAGYTAAPTVTIFDAVGAGTGATATATVDTGGVTSIEIIDPGSGYLTAGGIKKFIDDLPGLCDPAVPGSCPDAAAANNLGKYIPLAAPIQKNYTAPNGGPIKADVYDIGLVQYRTRFSSSLPAGGALVRGYVQIATAEWKAAHLGATTYPLFNEWKDGTQHAVMENGVQLEGVTPPQWLGPTIAATKNKPVRITFHNLLPTGVEGNLFLPVDTTLMGSGDGPVAMVPPTDSGTVMDGVRNPKCTDNPQDPDCFKQNRATLHLHGGITPWISDGTPHQWVTPANEDTAWPQGVSVKDVPDMTPMDQPRDGIQTFYYTNQQSARLLFYHDHAWGITRLNVYVGEAAGYLIGDKTEQQLVNNNIIPGPADTIPLIVQERTFVPQDAQLYDVKDPVTQETITYGQDPTWDKAKWGSYGDLWYHHVYMPAQNPGDPSGMSAYGRWMYGPWFWPPAVGTQYGPIANPYYDPNCDLNKPATWTYQTDPFCEPQQIPGTPNIAAGMEQFNDTPIVNGVAYPTVTLQPRTYRFRVLNAANDRFFNLQWYTADPSTGTLSEVALDPLLLQQAQTDPVVFPTPVGANNSAYGPDWVQIGTEGGFLPAPTVVDGQQPTTWITDPTRFDVGNVDLHSLLLAPAERADVIVDFSQFAGQTLILYNDAPAAFPARVPSYDYYTGGPDLAPNGAPTVIPGYGPNTRTVMQVKIAASAPAPAFNVTALRNAFSHKADSSGVFESSQNPIIVGQAAYNSAYGTGFSTGSNCNAPNSTLNICDGLVRVNDTMTFGFNTLKAPTTKTTIPLQPKAIHDEMNSTTFDEFGRMQSNLGLEAQPPTPGLQNVTLYPFINPATELLDGTNLPREAITYDADGNPVSDVKIQPLSNASDGTQIWRITHNGVDTHPIHFHLYDVQLVNRVTWDNIIILTDPAELGWKDTIRVAPLEDTVVALRPIIPQIPWELPNAIRNLSPMMPTGATKGFNNIDPQGNPTAPITNQLVNFGWEYVWHCHILSHEEMDMMRPQNLALPPVAPSNLTNTLSGGGTLKRAVLTWNDNSITETAFVVQRSANLGSTWTTLTTIQSPLDQPNVHQTRTFTDPSQFNPTITTRYYRVIAQNRVGYGAEFPTMTVQSLSNTRVVGPSFTITATAGANGTISPSGAVVVGRGGSQTFTVTPNANFRVDTVTVDGAPAVLTNGTYTFTNVQAAHSINVTFAQGAVTITATQAPGGSITPAGATQVAIGGSLTYTITPNNGYQRATVLIDNVNDPTAVATGQYTFTGVNAPHTITATFTALTPTITVTAPAAGTAWPANTPSIGFTLSSPVSVGAFNAWIINTVTGTWYAAGSTITVVPGLPIYTHSFSIAGIPDGTYTAVVYYRPDASVWGGWTANGSSAVGAATITSPLTLAVTSPAAGTSWLSGTGSIVFTVSTPVGAGAFNAWVINIVTGVWYAAGFSIAPDIALNEYTDTFSLAGIPPGTYTAVVYYRPDAAVWGGWTASATSSYGAVTIP